MKEIDETFKKICWNPTFDGEALIMKEIEKAFNELWDSTFNDEADVFSSIRMTEELVKETIQNLRKENFELYKALHGVKHPEDV